MVYLRYTNSYYLSPVTPSSISSALAQSCLIFKSAGRSQKNLIFFKKRGLSRHPYSNHGIARELEWRSIAFIQNSCWRVLALSQRFNCSFIAFTMAALCFTVFALRWRCVEDAVTSQRTPYNLRANTTDDHGFCTTTLVHACGAPIAL